MRQEAVSSVSDETSVNVLGEPVIARPLRSEREDVRIASVLSFGQRLLSTLTPVVDVLVAPRGFFRLK